MRTITGILSEIEESQKAREGKLWQQNFLYPLLFRDDLYAIAYNRSSNKLDLRKIENSKLNKNFSFLILKRLIRRIRWKNYFPFFGRNHKKKFDVDYKNNLYLEAIREGITVVLEIISSTQLKPIAGKGGGLNEWTSYQSIHSVFPFIEDTFRYSHFILDSKIPLFIHPELLIRIFRRRIRDTSLFHLLRFIIHRNRDSITLDIYSIYSQKEITRLSLFLWNLYIYELESSLAYLLWKDLGNFRLLSHLALLDETNRIRKIQGIIKPSWIVLQKCTFFRKKPSFHYVRHGNKSILSVGGIYHSAEKWKYFFFKIWQYHFHFLFESYGIRIKKIPKNCFHFLGYTFDVQNKIIVVRAKMLDELLGTSLINKELCSIAPILPLIGLLARERFCNTLGHPIGKLAWTTLTDEDIFNRFDQIWRNLFYYYSGCPNRKNLYQVQYILRFSCAKTLACKHKNTIRSVWKKYDLKFFTKSFFSKKKELMCSNFYGIYPPTKKIWYLDITRINSLAGTLQGKNLL
uniref:Maturase K n=1 Tax=Flatbergium novo-caledoniae TaxID=1846179 RepID=A0A172N7I0_9BRYO|nr:putative maturase [Flatbergium novo-caledoniae]